MIVSEPPQPPKAKIEKVEQNTSAQSWRQEGGQVEDMFSLLYSLIILAVQPVV